MITAERIRPTWRRRARSAWDSAHPELWDAGVVDLFPSFGNTGGRFLDASGEGRHAYLQSTEASDWHSYGFEFSTNDWASIATPGSIATLRTLSVWLAPTNWGQNGLILNSTEWQFTVGLYSSGLILVSPDGSLAHGGGYDSSFLSANEWHHICAVMNSSPESHQLFIDGAEQSSSSSLEWSAKAGTTIACRDSSSPNGFYDGSLDGLQVWERALKPTEIRVLAADRYAKFRLRRRTIVSVPAAPPAGSAGSAGRGLLTSRKLARVSLVG